MAKKPAPIKEVKQIRPGLTAKQDAFVVAYLVSMNGPEAYRKSYDAEGMSQASIEREANRLINHPRIAPYLLKLVNSAQARALLTLEDHMKELQNLRDLAKNDGKWSAAIQAEVKRGELRRFYVTQVEQGDKGEFENASEQELDEYIKQNADLVPVSQQKAGRATKH
jgi:phage terminase small subunit